MPLDETQHTLNAQPRRRVIVLAQKPQTGGTVGVDQSAEIRINLRHVQYRSRQRQLVVSPRALRQGDRSHDRQAAGNRGKWRVVPACLLTRQWRTGLRRSRSRALSNRSCPRHVTTNARRRSEVVGVLPGVLAGWALCGLLGQSRAPPRRGLGSRDCGCEGSWSVRAPDLRSRQRSRAAVAAGAALEPSSADRRPTCRPDRRERSGVCVRFVTLGDDDRARLEADAFLPPFLEQQAQVIEGVALDRLE